MLEEYLKETKKLKSLDEVIIRKMVGIMFKSNIKIRTLENANLNIEKEIEGYKQKKNITAYINDNVFVCIKLFSKKNDKNIGISYGLLVYYPFYLFNDEETKKIFTKKLCTFIYRNVSKELDFHILIDLHYPYIKNPKLPKDIIAEFRSRIIKKSQNY